MRFQIPRLFSTASLALACLGTCNLYSSEIDKKLYGDWTLDFGNEDAGWLRIERGEDVPVVYMRIEVGSAGPHRNIEIEDGRIQFILKEFRRTNDGRMITRRNSDAELILTEKIEIGMKNGEFDGLLKRIYAKENRTESIPFSGKRIPPMPASPPDLSKVCFGMPRPIFNGKDLTGWSPRRADKINGWSVEDGMLVNSTPKTDFSSTGAYANLRTDAVFEDFWLHIEFLADSGQNSGVYLRGMYEAQVVDRDSRMQGIQGIGAVFSKVAPSVQAATEPGTWQTYDLLLVDRHITIMLNGVTVVDNAPVDGPTGGAMHTDPMTPGPIYLQGDHTAIKYRNIYLAPVIYKDK